MHPHGVRVVHRDSLRLPRRVIADQGIARARGLDRQALAAAVHPPGRDGLVAGGGQNGRAAAASRDDLHVFGVDALAGAGVQCRYLPCAGLHGQTAGQRQPHRCGLNGTRYRHRRCGAAACDVERAAKGVYRCCDGDVATGCQRDTERRAGRAANAGVDVDGVAGVQRQCLARSRCLGDGLVDGDVVGCGQAQVGPVEQCGDLRGRDQAGGTWKVAGSDTSGHIVAGGGIAVDVGHRAYRDVQRVQ